MKKLAPTAGPAGERANHGRGDDQEGDSQRSVKDKLSQLCQQLEIRRRNLRPARPGEGRGRGRRHASQYPAQGLLLLFGRHGAVPTDI